MSNIYGSPYDRQIYQRDLEYLQQRISDYETVIGLLIPLAAHGTENGAAKEAVVAMGAALTRMQISQSYYLQALQAIDQEEQKAEDSTDVAKP